MHPEYILTTKPMYSSSIVVFIQKVFLMVLGSYLTYYFGAKLTKMMNLEGDEPCDEIRCNKVAKHFGVSLGNFSDTQKAVLGSVILPTEVKVSFDDLVGLDETKDLLKRLLLHKNPKLKRINGIILYGKPGTGKTMLAKCLAAELKSAFLVLSINDIENKYYGESGKKLNAFFDVAKMLKPTVVFMDEIDGFGGKRSSLDQSHVTNLKNSLLMKMDGILSTSEHITFIGATNRLDSVDEAVKRRMRLHIEVNLPPPEAISQLIHKHAKIYPDTELTALCEGMSGSDIEQMCILGEYEAIKHNRSDVSLEDLRVAHIAIDTHTGI